MADSPRRSAPGLQVLPWRTALLAVLLAWALQGLEPSPAPASAAPGQEGLSAAQLRSQLGGAGPVPVTLTIPVPVGSRPGAESGRVVSTSAVPTPASFKGAASR